MSATGMAIDPWQPEGSKGDRTSAVLSDHRQLTTDGSPAHQNRSEGAQHVVAYDGFGGPGNSLRVKLDSG